MGFRHGRRIAALAAFAAAWMPAAAAGAAIGPQHVEALDRQGATEIIVRREPGLSAAERADVRAAADVALTRRSALADTEVVRADKGDLAEAVAELNRDPDVVYAEPVVVQSALSADPYWSSLWALHSAMDVPEAWASASGTGVTVGVVDTGLLRTHPDLVNQLALNPGEAAVDKRSNGVDDDGNGYVDDWNGYDFVTAYPSIGVYEGDTTAGPDNDPQDDNGHGTHVAGTIAAQRDNHEGIAGVAPGARIMPLRALGSNGRGTNIAIAEAFAYAGRMGIRVVNASLGGAGLDQTQLSAIQAYPNTLYVVAAGNSNVNNDVTPHGPCALPAANILCVGASDENDRRASFSNYGAASVDVFAPGTSILSTYTSQPYAYLQGTSMASPNTAGVAALVLSVKPGASALEIKSAIMASTESKPDLAGKAVTGGRVNADRAVYGTLAGAPVNVAPPVINGSPRQGAVLSATSGTWNPVGTSYAYAWQRSFDSGATWTTIAGATGSTYTAGASDLSAWLRVTVTATNPYGVASATSAHVGAVASGAPANTNPPVISGTPRRGQTLTVNTAWNPGGTSYSYQWQRSADGSTWTDIGAGATSYTLTTAERETRVRVTVTAANAYGQVSVTSEPIGPVVWDPPVNTAPPAISGTTQRTFTLTAAAGTWEGAGNTISYQWQRDGANIPGATASTYKLAKDDEGARVRALVTATNVDGTASVASAPGAAPVSPFPPANLTAPVITGTPQRSKTLSATRGTWTGPDNMYGYQWQRDFGEGFVDIAGASGAAYTLTVDDVDAEVRVVVTATNPDATIFEASDPTTPVLAAGPRNLSPPTVTGSARRGLTLTGSLGSWDGIGNAYAYQWQRDGTDVPGATGSTYTLTTDDIGAQLRLRVTVTNPDGSAATASAATATVTSAPPVNTVRPAITGTVQRAATLTASQGTWTGNGNTYAYRWQRDGTNIPDATGDTYTLTADDVGTAIRVVVTASNPDGVEAAASTPTATVPSAPPVNTVRPAVTGTAQRASTLTGSAGTWGGIGNAIGYQWQTSPDGTTWTAIADASSPAYAVAVDDVGSYLRLLVTVSNPDGIATAVSTATARVTSAPPANTAPPTITGTAQRGSTLSAGQGTWAGIGNTYSYQWQRGATNIPDATGPTYTLGLADVGATVRVIVTAANPDAVVSAASAPTATVPSARPVNTVRPAIGGTARRGSTLTGTTGTWSGIGNSYAYQWQRDGMNIPGATSLTYTLAVADVGATVRLLVTADNPEGSASQASTPTGAVAGDGPANSVPPTIAGTAQRGATLTASAGTWTGIDNTYAYQWQRDGTNVPDATGATYALTADDVGKAVRVLVTAANPEGSAGRASAATAAVRTAPPVNTGLPTITGAAVRTSLLTVSQGTWGGAGNTYAYQWQQDAGSGYSDVPGATGTTYVLGVADVGKRFRVRVTATNADAAVAATSLATGVVQAGPPACWVAPAISGTARRTETLTARTGTWTGIGNAYAYQWQRRVSATWTDIAGATGTSYTLVAADVGVQIRVRVTASNPDGTVSAVSAATAAVEAAPPRNGALPAITGPAKLGATLTATPGDWTPAGADYTYAWQRDGAQIATGATYTLQPADVGRTVRVKVTATNADGSVSATSAASERIAAPPVNTTLPAAPSGTPRELSTLTADPGRWDTAGASLSYTWVRCATGCDAVGTGSTYTLSASDVGHRMGVRVTAASNGGETTAASALTAVVSRLTLANLALPSISGNAYAGETLRADAGRWSFASPDIAYEWRRGGVPVGSGPDYALSADDAGHDIVLVVTATTPGQSAVASSAPLAIRARPVPLPVAAPTVSGTPTRGRTLSAGTGTWNNGVTRFGYQWKRCSGAGCQEIAGATGDRYLLTKADVGFAVTVVVTAVNAAGSGSATAAPTGPVAAAPPVNTRPPVIESDVIQQGATLTVTGYAWDAPADTTYGIAWERCDGGGCRPIAGATGAQYTLVAADVGQSLVAISTAANVDGTAAARSAATAVAAIGGPRWRTLPLVAGDGNRVGDTVTATAGTWSGPPVTARATEVMRCTNVCVARTDHTTYRIADGDLGAIIRVRETASNAGGESVVWSARYVGPIVSAQAAAAVLAKGETKLRNARGATLALAKQGKGKVKLRRPGRVKGKLVAWACPAAVSATPPPCTAKVSLRKRATLRLPASTDRKVRVVVIRSRA
jgi:subtilisin family serine protease